MTTRRVQKKPVAYNRLTPRQLMWRRLRPFLYICLLGISLLLLSLLLRGERGAAVGRYVASQLASIGYVTKTIGISGHDRTSKADILQTLDIPENTPILALNLPTLQQKMMGLNWVEDVHIHRQLPDTLRIVITERAPIALYKQPDGTIVLIDQSGKILARNKLKQFGRYLLVEGEGADKDAHILVNALSRAPDIAVQVKIAKRISNRRWDLILDNTRIKLPDDDAIPASLLKISQDNLLTSETTPQVIDLRLPDKPKVFDEPK